MWDDKFGTRKNTAMQAKTNNFIEDGLKLSFTPCTIYIVLNWLLHIKLSYSSNYAVKMSIKEIKHSRREVHEIRQKILQLTILKY